MQSAHRRLGVPRATGDRDAAPRSSSASTSSPTARARVHIPIQRIDAAIEARTGRAAARLPRGARRRPPSSGARRRAARRRRGRQSDAASSSKRSTPARRSARSRTRCATVFGVYVARRGASHERRSIDHVAIVVADLEAHDRALHATRWASSKSIARSSPTRASRRSACGPATRSSSCCARSRTTRRSRASAARRRPSCTTPPTASTTSRPNSPSSKAQGVRLIDERPRRGAHGNLIAFLHPKSTGGVLIELCQHVG